MDTKDKALRLFKRVNTFIISCVDSEGYPLSKAVVPGKLREGLMEMFFCTNTSSRFTSEVLKSGGCGKASVYFYSRRLLWKGCLLRGKMEVVTDPALKERYWQTKFKNAYKEQSYLDPDFCLLKFVPISGRYYANYKPQDFALD